MFKNRAVQLTLTKPDAAAEGRVLDKDEVIYWNAVVRSNVEALGKGLIVLYAAKKAIDTASVLIIKAAS